MINKPELNLGKIIHIKIVIISAKLGDYVGDTYVEYNFQGKNYTTKIVIYSLPRNYADAWQPERCNTQSIRNPSFRRNLTGCLPLRVAFPYGLPSLTGCLPNSI